MILSKFRKNPVVKILLNTFVIILVTFMVWMFFFDENSYLTHRKFNTEIEKLEKTNRFYKKKIDQDKATIKNLQDSVELQRFAREKYLMKKENEDIYLIEFDTLKK